MFAIGKEVYGTGSSMGRIKFLEYGTGDLLADGLGILFVCYSNSLGT